MAGTPGCARRRADHHPQFGKGREGGLVCNAQGPQTHMARRDCECASTQTARRTMHVLQPHLTCSRPSRAASLAASYCMYSTDAARSTIAPDAERSSDERTSAAAAHTRLGAPVGACRGHVAPDGLRSTRQVVVLGKLVNTKCSINDGLVLSGAREQSPLASDCPNILCIGCSAQGASAWKI